MRSGAYPAFGAGKFIWIFSFGGDEEDRTPDLCIANAALSQLSYAPTNRAESISTPVAPDRPDSR